MQMFGASFSAVYCRELQIDPEKCLEAALGDLGVRRLRLMSYWNVHEAVQGKYDFAELDWQVKLAEQYGAEITLCLGLRQPRWPESHWPQWARELPDKDWQQALLDYITAVVERYKSHSSIVSWQLENEALLKTFGIGGNFDRHRLKREFGLVKELDPTRPVIMTTSDSWGIPFFGPKPDKYGFSIYRYFYDRGDYRHSGRWPVFYWLRAGIIRIFKWRSTYIHELQTEPWGPKATAKLPLAEQFKSMNLARVNEAVLFARQTHLRPVDIWGLEWWYYLQNKHNHSQIWDYMRSVFRHG